MSERSSRPLSYPSAPGQHAYDRTSQLPWLAAAGPLRDSYDSLEPPSSSGSKLYRASSETLESKTPLHRDPSPGRVVTREARYRKRRRGWLIAGSVLLVLATAGGVVGGVLGSKAARQNADDDNAPFGTLLAPTPVAPVAATANYDSLVVFGASYWCVPWRSIPEDHAHISLQ
jgi:hypothetical protein